MIENTISIDTGDTADSEYTLPEQTPHTAETAQTENICGAEQADTVQETAEGLEQTDAEAAAEKPSADTMELTLYGEKLQVPVHQAVAAAQKGMAFEHIKGQLSAAKNDVRLKMLEDVAAMKGQTMASFVGDIQRKALADEITAKYGSFENAPTQVLEQAVRKIEQSRISLENGEIQAEQHRIRGQLMEFLENNPGCREIPSEVVELVKKGENLSLAYSRFNEQKLSKELTEAKRELEILKNDERSRKTSTPSARNIGAVNENKENEFLKLMKSTW